MQIREFVGVREVKVRRWYGHLPFAVPKSIGVGVLVLIIIAGVVEYFATDSCDFPAVVTCQELVYPLGFRECVIVDEGNHITRSHRDANVPRH
ncbi:hypothetical protein D3C77_360820 [compost metagenome]